jgi:DNA (cytosine-5)-methyltransferase 1
VANVALSSISLCTGLAGIESGLSDIAKPVCYVEREAFNAAWLASKITSKELPEAPIWSDLRYFDARPFANKVDLVTAGYPCQPYSRAGKRAGTEDSRNLWPQVLRVLKETKAWLLFCENVREHCTNGLQQVLEELSDERFNVEWGTFSAKETGAPHIRERLFFVAYSDKARLQRLQHELQERDSGSPWSTGWETTSRVPRVDDGVPNYMERVTSLGNAVCPQTARKAFFELIERIR